MRWGFWQETDDEDAIVALMEGFQTMEAGVINRMLATVGGVLSGVLPWLVGVEIWIEEFRACGVQVLL